MKVRIKYSKTGPVKFISHLDVMRYFQKVIRRSGLPVTYSQGFSPHQLMSFALPLGVGVTSDGEYMEVEFDEDALMKLAGCEAGQKDASKLEQCVFDGMRDHTTEGFEILAVRALPAPKPNVHIDKAMALVSAADYLIRLKDGYDTGFASADEFYGAFDAFLSQDVIEVTKKTKKSEQRLNIREFIYGYGTGNVLHDMDGTLEERRDGIRHAAEYESGIQIMLRLSAGSVMNIKPELVLEAFLNTVGRTYDENAFAQHRMELYMGEAQALVPLIK